MLDIYRDRPDALENTVKIADRCQVDLSLGQTRLPKYPAPSGKNADDYLAELCFLGLKKRFEAAPKEYVERLKYEPESDSRHGFQRLFFDRLGFHEVRPR